MCYNFGISIRLDGINSNPLCIIVFFPQSKREVDRRLEELRDHYERGDAETERKLRRELKKTKALLRDAQAVIETQVSCHPHSTPLRNFLGCFLHLTLSLLLFRVVYQLSFVFVFQSQKLPKERNQMKALKNQVS